MMVHKNEKESDKKVVFTDYTSKLDSAHIKLLTALSVSISVSGLSVSGESSFLGIKFDNINERLLETVVFLSAIFFFVNYALRLFDERNVFSGLDKELLQIQENCLQTTRRIKDSLLDEMELMEHFKSIEGALQRVPKINAEFIDMLAKLNVPQPKLNRLSSNLTMMVAEKQEYLIREMSVAHTRLSTFSDLSTFLKASTVMSNVAKEIESVQRSLIRKKNFAFLARIRIVFVNWIVPAVMGVIAILTYLFPNSMYEPLLEIASFLYFSHPADEFSG